MRRDPNTRIVQRPPAEDVVYKQRVSHLSLVKLIDRSSCLGLCQVFTTTNTTCRRNDHRPRETGAWSTTGSTDREPSFDIREQRSSCPISQVLKRAPPPPPTPPPVIIREVNRRTRLLKHPHLPSFFQQPPPMPAAEGRSETSAPLSLFGSR